MSREHRVALGCPLCGEIVEPDEKILEGFRLKGYNMLEWLAVGEPISDIEETWFLHCDKIPSVGQTRFALAKAPFNFAVDDIFWSLYEPALVYFNGYETQEDFNSIGAVHCKFDKIIDKNDQQAWIQLTILDVILLSEICEKWPATYNPNFLNLIKRDSNCHVNKMSNWTDYSLSFGGDVGYWAIVYRDNKGIEHVVVFGYWDFHHEDVYFGNIVITP